MSLVTLICVLILIWKELEYFWNPDPTFQFVPDADFEAKLQINIDMTVAIRYDSPKFVVNMLDILIYLFR